MKTVNEMRLELAEKAAGDESFRKSLISDPKAAIAKEYGVTIPNGMEIAVHEDSATNAHLILSPNPKLSDEDLKRVSGAWGGSSSLNKADTGLANNGMFNDDGTTSIYSGPPR